MVDGARLTEILQEESRLLGKMIELEEETQYLLLRGDAMELETLNMQKEKFFARLTELDEERKNLFPSGTTLEQYLTGEKPRNSGELEEIRRLLLKLHASLQQKLKVNRYLLRHNLSLTRLALNSLFPWRKDSTIYASSGEQNEKMPFAAGFVDSNA